MPRLHDKNIRFHCLCLTILFLLAMVSAADAAGPLNETIDALAADIAADLPGDGKLRVAVARFKTMDNQTSFFGKLVAEKLTNELIAKSKGRFAVMERSLVDRLMGERIDLTAEEAHKLLEAEVLVTGVYTVLKKNVDIMARAIDLSTAKAIAAAQNSVPLEGLRNLLDPEEKKQSHKSQANDLTLGVQVLSLKFVEGKEREVVVKSGDTIYSGDQFKINFKSDRDCYLYVLYYDSMDQAGVLFPHPKIALDNRIRGNVEYSIPGGDQVFYVDENRGTETMYLVASLKPMRDIARLLSEMEKAGGEGQKKLGSRLRSIMDARGFGVKSANAPSAFANRERVMELVKGQGSLSKVFEFLHR